MFMRSYCQHVLVQIKANQVEDEKTRAFYFCPFEALAHALRNSRSQQRDLMDERGGTGAFKPISTAWRRIFGGARDRRPGKEQRDDSADDDRVQGDECCPSAQLFPERSPAHRPETAVRAGGLGHLRDEAESNDEVWEDDVHGHAAQHVLPQGKVKAVQIVKTQTSDPWKN